MVNVCHSVHLADAFLKNSTRCKKRRSKILLRCGLGKSLSIDLMDIHTTYVT